MGVGGCDGSRPRCLEGHRGVGKRPAKAFKEDEGERRHSPEEQAKFAAAAQPAVRKLIEEKLGAEGTDMLNAMMAEIKANQ